MLPWVSEFLSIILQVSDDEVAVTTQDLRHLQAVHAILKEHMDSSGFTRCLFFAKKFAGAVRLHILT